MSLLRHYDSTVQKELNILKHLLIPAVECLPASSCRVRSLVATSGVAAVIEAAATVTGGVFVNLASQRKDIWWFERDGSNMEDAVENIALSFVDQGRSWFQRYIDLETSFADVELERDCYVKYHKASYLAKELGLDAKHKMYAELRDAAMTRIDNRFV